jgi:hypothetical protein
LTTQPVPVLFPLFDDAVNLSSDRWAGGVWLGCAALRPERPESWQASLNLFKRGADEAQTRPLEQLWERRPIEDSTGARASPII